MDTAIGAGFRSSPRVQRFSLWAALILVAIDLLVVAFRAYLPLDLTFRFSLALIGVLCWTFLIAGQSVDGSTFGFRVPPRKGWLYWIRFIIAFDVAIFAIFFTLAIGFSRGHNLPKLPWESLSQAWPYLIRTCFAIPLQEEVMYRLVFCPPIASKIGARWCIALNGVVFIGLHVLYGSLSLFTLVGAFLIPWSYFKSETLLVPLAFHAIHNVFFALSVAFAYAW